MDLQSGFYNLFGRYTPDASFISDSWKVFFEKYTASGRHYHNLTHIENLLDELEGVREKIDDWDVLQFSVFYHDIIYSPTSSNNEVRSAAFAKTTLSRLEFAPERQAAVVRQIEATKNHVVADDSDTNYLLDADLSVLGKAGDEYLAYTKNIRKEYDIYPKLIYNHGRKKVIQHFLQLDRIYKTAYFFEKYEQQARKNLLVELQLL